MSTNAIEVENVTKKYTVREKSLGVLGAAQALFVPKFREIAAVKDLSFNIKKSEIVGFIGVNGAGKSTTIKMLTGILTPTLGSVRVLGVDPYSHRRSNAQKIGVVFGQRTQLWWDLPLKDSLDLISRIYRVDRHRYMHLLEFFSEELELGDLLNQPVRQMSLGQRMRSELAAVMIHEPSVLFLDEPTIGLDIFVKDKIRKFLLKENTESGNTILLTTHDLSDIEEMCNRVIIVDAGQLIFEGSLSELRRMYGNERELKIEFKSHEYYVPDIAGIVVTRGYNDVVVKFDKTLIPTQSIIDAFFSRNEISDFSLQDVNLETIVMQLNNSKGVQHASR